MANKFYTYKTIPKGFINIKARLIGDDPKNVTEIDFSKVDECIFPGWQKNQSVIVTVSLSIIDEATEKIKKLIREDKTASVYLCFHSPAARGGTSIQRCFDSKDFTGESIKLYGKIPGEFISKLFELSVVIAISGEKKTDSQIKNSHVLASEIGSIIYEQAVTIYTEGKVSYFPMEDFDFSKANLPKGALYYLRHSQNTSLDADITTAYCLCWNNQHPDFQKAQDGEAPDLLKFILFDVFRKIIFDALRNPDFTELSVKNNSKQNKVKDFYSYVIGNLLREKFKASDSLNTLRNYMQNPDSEEYRNLECAIQEIYLWS